MKKLSIINIFIIILSFLLLIYISIYKICQKNNYIAYNKIELIESDVMDLRVQLEESIQYKYDTYSKIDEINTKIKDNKIILDDFINKYENDIINIETIQKTLEQKDVIISKELENYFNVILAKTEIMKKDIESNKLSTDILMENTNKKLDLTSEKLLNVEEKLSKDINSLRLDSEKYLKEIEKLKSEINRLDEENRLIHYNYDIVLKIARQNQLTSNYEKPTENKPKEIKKVFIEDKKESKLDSTKINENNDKKTNFFVRIYKWIFRKN